MQIEKLLKQPNALPAAPKVVLEFAVRLRDRRGVVHDELLSAPGDELTTYMPAVYDPLAAL